MPLWKTTDTDTDAGKPLSASLDPNINPRDVIATPSGWVHRKTYTDQHGNSRTKDEILVAIRGLSEVGKLGASTISDVRFAAATGATSSTGSVVVTYNEPVDVTGGAPTLNLLVANTTISTVLTSQVATYASGTTSNQLVFSFTAQSNGAIYTIQSGTIANTAGIKIVDTGTAVASDMTIPAAYAGANSAIGTFTTA